MWTCRERNSIHSTGGIKVSCESRKHWVLRKIPSELGTALVKRAQHPQKVPEHWGARHYLIGTERHLNRWRQLCVFCSLSLNNPKS
jgi:hypothetical protein